MAKELGVADPTQQPRDEGGRYEAGDVERACQRPDQRQRLNRARRATTGGPQLQPRQPVGGDQVTARINIDLIPKTARPTSVAQAIKGAEAMRARARAAAEAVAAAQNAVDEVEREDVEAAALRARAGEPLGATNRALTKTRDELLLKQRDLNALRLAQEQAEEDVVDAISERADHWAIELRAEADRAREQGRAALIALKDAFAQIGGSTSAQSWLAAASRDGRYDRAAKPTRAFALSSARRTANSEPLSVGDLLGYLHEAIEPLPTTATNAQT